MRPVIRLLDKAVRTLPDESGLRKLLIASAGNYCLACEIPLGSAPPVRERVCISEFGYKLDLPPGTKNLLGQTITGKQNVRISKDVNTRIWPNVMLFCDDCARQKKEAHSPDWEDGWNILLKRPDASSLLGSPVSPRGLDEARSIAAYRMAATTWIWPDTAEDWIWPTSKDSEAEEFIAFEGDDTWNMLTYELASYTPLQLEKLGLLRLSEKERKEKWASEQQKAIWVVPSPNLDKDKQRRVLATIVGFNLNYLNLSSSDRRVVLRSLAYAEAQSAIKQFAQHINTWKGDQPSLSRQLFSFSIGDKAALIRKAITTSGFWTIWAKSLVETAPILLKGGIAFWAVEAFLRNVLVQYEEDAVSKSEEMVTTEGEKEEEVNGEDDEASCFPMVIPGTDVRRLPKILGGPL